jgi:hypothetical protein
MTGLIEHFYRLSLLRLLGSIVLALSAWSAGRVHLYLEHENLSKPRHIRVGLGCDMLLSHGLTPAVSVTRPPPCAFRAAGSLSFLRSLGFKKKLRAVNRDDLTWIPGVGLVLARRVLRHRNAHSWAELVERTGISTRQRDILRAYLTL